MICIVDKMKRKGLLPGTQECREDIVIIITCIS